MKQLPVRCPSCTAVLKVRKLACVECDTVVEGSFDLGVFTYLSSEEQAFVRTFVKNSGSLKQMASELKLSYPSVRNMLDSLIDRMRDIELEIRKSN
jgi:hypothetical protein